MAVPEKPTLFATLLARLPEPAREQVYSCMFELQYPMRHHPVIFSMRSLQDALKERLKDVTPEPARAPEQLSRENFERYQFVWNEMSPQNQYLVYLCALSQHARENKSHMDVSAAWNAARQSDNRSIMTQARVLNAMERLGNVIDRRGRAGKDKPNALPLVQNLCEEARAEIKSAEERLAWWLAVAHYIPGDDVTRCLDSASEGLLACYGARFPHESGEVNKQRAEMTQIRLRSALMQREQHLSVQ